MNSGLGEEAELAHSEPVRIDVTLCTNVENEEGHLIARPKRQSS